MTLPRLVDCKGIQDELGITQHAAEAMMRQLKKVKVDGLAKVWVYREDLLRLLDESTKEDAA